MGCMRFRISAIVLAFLVSCIVVDGAAAAIAAASPSWRRVTFAGVSVEVPAAWPVIRLAAHPAACPDLGRHAVYLGTPGPAPHCPPGLVGKTESAWLTVADPASPDSRLATRAVRAGGQPARVNPDPAATHTVTVILPGPAVEVSVSWGRHPALARRIQASIRVAGPGQAPDGRAWNGAGRPSAPALARPLALPAANPAQSLYQGAGFDTCGAPATSVMSSWLASPYRAIGIYIGGLNRGCSQPNLTAGWIAAIQRLGWHYFPFYVGRQASCVVGQSGNVAITPARAAAQGKAAADDAAAQARALGLPPRTPIIYDMEAYAGCAKQVLTFLSAWDRELPADGYTAAVYESFSNVGDLVAASGTITEPALIHYADWDNQATTQSSYMPASMWLSHQRIHQFRGGHDEAWGGVTMDIDSDQVDAVLGGAAGPPAVRTAFRPAVGLDGGTAPDWFARAADRTLVHDVQQPSGSWSGVTPVGSSPANIASNPAVVANANGQLTVTARTTGSELAYAWQNPAAAGGWTWGGTVPAAGSPGTLTGTPAAARRPNGEAEFFATGPGGAVLVTHQTAANANRSWSAWKNIGGRCASTPVPFTTPAGRLELFCRTVAGTAALTQWTGKAWTAWQQVGASPANLTATPAVVASAAGQVELLATTAAGELDLAWQSKQTGRWHWVTPVAAGPVLRSPAAIAWPDGRVRVFAQLGNGTLGILSQRGGTAKARWSAWAAAAGAMAGSPAVWVSAAGVPGAAVLAASGAMAAATYRNGSWTALAQLGGQF